ncbi:hypothetical protein NQ317_005550 [Molorchus minor]|uniref:Alcohol dehydrogenase n=1 Tax=Molorchus minor TaxID=1323400 RepID=A0ABQ9JW42_9CUCU|nr:hypothetical protein NQ317_005550 [Molorchus minor]
MVFDFTDKVALVTGGASGIGLRYAKELLRNGVKAVTLADIDPQFGQKALKDIEEEFGPKKAIFVKTDVTDIRQFEDAFKKTVETFKNVDILFNNAGVLNDAIWEKEIAINVNGTINGVLLGLENYLKQYRQGSEGVIVNISSIAGISPFAFIPIYCATKAAVIGLTTSWGTPEHYQRTKVRVFAICPGVTTTPLISDMSGRNLGPEYETIMIRNVDTMPLQPPEHVAKEVVSLIKTADNGTIWVVEGGKPGYQFVIPERRL